MLNSAFLYSFQSNKETENQMFKIGLGRIGCLHHAVPVAWGYRLLKAAATAAGGVPAKQTAGNSRKN